MLFWAFMRGWAGSELTDIHENFKTIAAPVRGPLRPSVDKLLQPAGSYRGRHTTSPSATHQVALIKCRLSSLAAPKARKRSSPVNSLSVESDST